MDRDATLDLKIVEYFSQLLHTTSPQEYRQKLITSRNVDKREVWEF